MFTAASADWLEPAIFLAIAALCCVAHFLENRLM